MNRILDARHLRVPLIAAIVSVAFFTSSSADDEVEGRGRAAGTYFIDIASEIIPFTIPGMIALTRDGRVLATEATNPFESPGFGTWKRVRARKAKGQFLFFVFNPQGEFVQTGRVRFRASFDKRFMKAVAPFEIAFFDAGQDVLDPDEIPPLSFEGTMTFRRIAAE